MFFVVVVFFLHLDQTGQQISERPADGTVLPDTDGQKNRLYDLLSDMRVTRPQAAHAPEAIMPPLFFSMDIGRAQFPSSGGLSFAMM